MTVHYVVSGLFLLFFWCTCMAINVSVQYISGLLPDTILLCFIFYFLSLYPFRLVFVLMVSLELCRGFSDLFMSTRPRAVFFKEKSECT